MRARLSRIKDRVARLPALAASSESRREIRSPLRPNPPLSEAALHAFEAEYRVALPDEYRLFLREVGDGGPGPGAGLLRLADAVERSPSHDLATPFPFSVRQYREDPDRFYWERSNAEWQPWPGVLYLSDPLGEWGDAYLVVTGEDRGMVWGYGPINCGWTPECPTTDADNRWAHGELRSFLRWYEDWLDVVLAGSDAEPSAAADRGGSS